MLDSTYLQVAQVYQYISYITCTRRRLAFGIKIGDHIPHHNNGSPVFCSISTSQLISPRESRSSLDLDRETHIPQGVRGLLR